jgi:hypothetical protein
MTDLLDQPERAGNRGGRILVETKRQPEEEENLRVGRALDERIEPRIDREHEVALHLQPIRNNAVVRPQPLAVAERVAVRLLHRRSRRRADVGDEEVRLDVAGELAQVAVVPGRFHALEGARAVPAVPADPEAVPVRRLRAHARLQALLDQGVLRPIEDLVHQNRLSGIRKPTTHDPSPF